MITEHLQAKCFGVVYQDADGQPVIREIRADDIRNCPACVYGFGRAVHRLSHAPD